MSHFHCQVGEVDIGDLATEFKVREFLRNGLSKKNFLFWIQDLLARASLKDGEGGVASTAQVFL